MCTHLSDQGNVVQKNKSRDNKLLASFRGRGSLEIRM